MESDYTGIIIVAFLGFVVLAALLLVPVWRFLRREEESARQWTSDTVASPADERTNGTGDRAEEPPLPE